MEDVLDGARAPGSRFSGQGYRYEVPHLGPWVGDLLCRNEGCGTKKIEDYKSRRLQEDHSARRSRVQRAMGTYWACHLCSAIQVEPHHVPQLSFILIFLLKIDC